MLAGEKEKTGARRGSEIGYFFFSSRRQHTRYWRDWSSDVCSSDLHPASGGSGAELCSGDMLLEALVACAGVTLKAVATALEIDLRKGVVKAEGDLDFRGTLGVAKAAPVGFRSIRLAFEPDTDAPQEKLDQLLKLTERYCVVFQTLNQKPELAVEARRAA